LDLIRGDLYPAFDDSEYWDWWNPWPNRSEYSGKLFRMVGSGWSVQRKDFVSLPKSPSRLGVRDWLAPHIMPPWAIHELDEPDDIPLIEGLLEMRKAGKI